MKDVCLTLGGLVEKKKPQEVSRSHSTGAKPILKIDQVIGSNMERVIGKGRT